MGEAPEKLPPGWHLDEDTGAWVRDVIHRMGRRCRNWDYAGRGSYLITITLEDRRSRALGRLMGASAEEAHVELSDVGRLVEDVLLALPLQWPGIEIPGYIIMPDHIHFVVAVKARQMRPLGAIVGSFKSRSTSRWLDLLGRKRPSTAAPYHARVHGKLRDAPRGSGARGGFDLALYQRRRA